MTKHLEEKETCSEITYKSTKKMCTKFEESERVNVWKEMKDMRLSFNGSKSLQRENEGHLDGF